ncbi:IclR family transcriptional regulator [Orrella sp. JC864]|uniref:IclR family transcriptional regulator n=1 Tax=Orrella sp. JC864 TaxID=3120298 RepID=UPI0012BCD465
MKPAAATDDPALPAPPGGAAADKLFVLSVGKCFHLLECLNQAQRPLTLTELAQMSGLEKSAVQRLTHTLRQLGYLRQHPQTRAYALSSRMLEFGHTVLSTDPVREIAQPHLEALNRATSETVNLMELEGLEIVYVLRYASVHPVSVNLHVGSRLPAFCTAAGRAIMAQLPAEQAEAILAGPRQAMTEHTVTDAETLRKLMRQWRAQGYVINDQEAFIGDISVAAPVYNGRREPVGAVNIAVPVPRWDAPRVKRELVAPLLRCAQAITRELSQSL